MNLIAKPATIIKTATAQSKEVLRRCITPKGFRASGQAVGYPQIWARDSIASFIGAFASEDQELIDCGKMSLVILGEFQNTLGYIPLNVNPESGYSSTENAGACDSNLWYILGHFLNFQMTGDINFLRESWNKIDQAMKWLVYQDMNNCGLLEIPEAGNWMDLLAVRYNTLYDNVLFYAAILACERLHGEIRQNAGSLIPHNSAAEIHERINLLMWVDRCWVAAHFAEHLEKLKTIRLEWFMLYHNIGTISSRPYYLPWVAFREYGDWCDSLANILAILTGIADGHKAQHILRFMQQVGMAEPYPTKAIYPPIYPGEENWREYYRSRNLNLPNQYHNGGIWPMIGGFHVAALVQQKWKDEAERLLFRLAEANWQGDKAWEFNEWLHGQTGHPMGYTSQGWSAASFLFAERAFRTGELMLFDDLIVLKPESAAAEEQNEMFIHPGGGPE